MSALRRPLKFPYSEMSFLTTTFRHKSSTKFLIVGGGTGGISMAAKILGLGEKNVTIIEPSDVHYYQPYWTLVGGKKKKLEESCRPMRSVMPKGVTWLKESVAKFDPSSNRVFTSNTGEIEYSCLVVALGIQLAFEKYHGYTSCPFVTGYGKGVMAEFNYELEPEETLSIDQGKERFLSYLIKKEILSFLYWNLMLKGKWSGPSIVRKILHLGLTK